MQRFLARNELGGCPAGRKPGTGPDLPYNLTVTSGVKGFGGRLSLNDCIDYVDFSIFLVTQLHGPCGAVTGTDENGAPRGDFGLGVDVRRILSQVVDGMGVRF